MSQRGPFFVGSARYGDRMTVTLEQLKSDVDDLRSRADVADSRAMETTRLLTDLKKDMNQGFMAVGTGIRGLYDLAKAVPDDIIRIDVNVGLINTNIGRISTHVGRLDRAVTVLREDMVRVAVRLDGLDERLVGVDQR